MVFKSHIPRSIDFWTLFAWEHIPASGLVLLEVSLDVIVLNILTMTKLQFRLLRYEVEKIFSYTSEKRENFSLKIKRCNEHHTFLLGDSLADILGAALYAAQMFFEFFVCYCFPAQDLTDEAELLSVTLYSNNWNLYPAYYKDIMIFLGKSRLEVIYSAGGLLNINHQTGMSVSIFNLFVYYKSEEVLSVRSHKFLSTK
nr:unnamed protein product [Callosobruchus analis]